MNSNGRIKVEREDDTDFGPANKGKKAKRQTQKAKDSLSVMQEKKEKKPKLKQEMITDHMPIEKKKRKIDRFNGMPEEEVIQRTLPDHLAPDLDIVIVGINPGLMAAYIGHHYAGPGNHFWKCLYLSGLVPEPKNCYDDFKLLELGIGFTNICTRTTRGSSDLKKTEIKEGATILKEKLREYRPKIAAFNGKGIYEIFSGSKNIYFGKQPDLIEGTNTIAFVMPSSSARCAQLPRAIDKVPFYNALRKLRDHLLGRLPQLDDAEVTFPNLELKCVKKEEPKEEDSDNSQESFSNCMNGAEEMGSNHTWGVGMVGTTAANNMMNMPRESTSNFSNEHPPAHGRMEQNQQAVNKMRLAAGSSQQFLHNQAQRFAVDTPQAEATFHMQQQQLSLQQQQQHLQHRLWEHQQQSLVGLPQAVPVSSAGPMNPSGLSSQFHYSQPTFDMSQWNPYTLDYGVHQSFDALGFPVGVSRQYCQQSANMGTGSGLVQQVEVKREPLDNSYVQS